jgi:HEAT repeat protein
MTDSIQEQILNLTVPNARREALAYLRKLGKDAVEPLIAALESATTPYLTTSIMSLLVEFHDKRAIEPIRKLTYASDERIRGNAGAALCQLDAANSLEDMGRVVSSHIESSQRSIILRTMGKLGKKDVAIRLVEQIIAGDQYRLEIAVNDLASFADPSMYDLFMSLLNHKSQFVLTGAMYGLGKLRDKRAVDKLITLLNHDNPTVRVSALTALGEIGDKRALASMKVLLRDESPSGHGDLGEKQPPVSAYAKMALKKLRPWWQFW